MGSIPCVAMLTGGLGGFELILQAGIDAVVAVRNGRVPGRGGGLAENA